MAPTQMDLVVFALPVLAHSGRRLATAIVSIGLYGAAYTHEVRRRYAAVAWNY